MKEVIGFSMLVFVLCIFDIVSTGAFETAGRVMPGQPHHVPVNNTKVLAAAQFAVVEFNRAYAEKFYYKIVNITSARVQVKLTFVGGKMDTYTQM